MKQIANAITGSRILCSFMLLIFDTFSTGFYILYFLCEFTDMIDGSIARKTNTVSEFGAKFDTVADFVFVFICLLKILPLMHMPVWLWVWIIIIALIKMFNIALVFIKNKKLISIHSILNKITGFALFLLPLWLNLYSVATICVLATVGVMQEIYFVSKDIYLK